MARDPEWLESLLGRVFQVGSTISAALLAAGLALTLARPDLRAGDFVLRAGLIILMATPVTRVVISVVGYVTERDWVFVTLTSIVLLLLLGSLLVA